jgi:hypothetical protein
MANQTKPEKPLGSDDQSTRFDVKPKRRPDEWSWPYFLLNVGIFVIPIAFFLTVVFTVMHYSMVIGNILLVTPPLILMYFLSNSKPKAPKDNHNESTNQKD